MASCCQVTHHYILATVLCAYAAAPLVAMRLHALLDSPALHAHAPDAVPLQPIVVTVVSRRLDNVGFYERQRRGIGTFIGRQQIDDANALFSSDLMRNVPGVRLVTAGARRDAPRAWTTGRGTCRFRFVIDGTRALPDFELDMIAPTAIEGIAVYAGLAQVPALFRPQAADGVGAVCGIIAVWTRNGR